MELRFRVGNQLLELVASEHDGRPVINIGERDVVLDDVSIDDRYVSLVIGGKTHRLLYESERGHVFIGSAGHVFEFVPGEEAAADAAGGAARFTPEISSPMPGKVLQVLVAPGDEVEADAALLLLEAMKMETTVRTTHRARVVEVRVEVGGMVGPGDVLVKLEELPEA
ncbi:MAG TPA: biotin/lipoyl-containing protein [Candidatus Limnocylindrales bacterium]|nr:biotin/lipoyl-containing protein [Candidatus Limnocylindrales bacterium]